MNMFILELFVVFIINLITSALSQLKYVFATKSKDWKMYALIGIDTLIYLYSLQLVLKNYSLESVLALTVGKLLGVTLANYLEDKLIKKLYNYEFYFPELEIVEDLENELYKHNISISSTTLQSKGKTRYLAIVQVNSFQADFIFNYLEDKWGISEPTATCVELIKTHGKINKRIKHKID